MELLGGIARWFADPAHWQGPAGVPARLGEHVGLTLISLVIAAVIGLAAGVGVGHTGRGAAVAVNVANLGRALPTFAVMGIVVPVTAAIDNQAGFKVWPALVGLIVLAIPPILVNAYAGVSGVDRELVEAGRAMGMRSRQVLLRLEIPVALPVILGGIRSATSQIVATATLAALFGGPGLGRFLVEGYAQLDYPMMFAGVILVGVVFVALEAAFAVAQARLTPAGIRAQRPDIVTRLEATLQP
jgi:osmoprotectant transport system permease protein